MLDLGHLPLKLKRPLDHTVVLLDFFLQLPQPVVDHLIGCQNTAQRPHKRTHQTEQRHKHRLRHFITTLRLYAEPLKQCGDGRIFEDLVLLALV